MRFCTQCDNMYYIRISSENENQLIYYCRKCGHEDDSVTQDSIVVCKTSTASDKAAYLNNINEFTKRRMGLGLGMGLGRPLRQHQEQVVMNQILM